MQHRIAVYRPNGRKLAEFATIEELCRVLEVDKNEVQACLLDWIWGAETRRKNYVAITRFTFKEIDETKQGCC